VKTRRSATKEHESDSDSRTGLEQGFLIRVSTNFESASAYRLVCLRRDTCGEHEEAAHFHRDFLMGSSVRDGYIGIRSERLFGISRASSLIISILIPLASHLLYIRKENGWTLHTLRVLSPFPFPPCIHQTHRPQKLSMRLQLKSRSSRSSASTTVSASVVVVSYLIIIVQRPSEYNWNFRELSFPCELV
jgi:hypothetical protein